MLRIGKTKVIEEQFNNCYLNFCCPANWIDLAQKDMTGTADKYEAVFAHVKKGDPRIEKLSRGNITNLVLGYWFDEGPDDTVYIRDVQMCLKPMLCVYSLDLVDAAKHFGIRPNTGDWIEIDLRPYMDSMTDSKMEDYSVMVIYEPTYLMDELKREIPKVVSSYVNIEKRFFDPDDPVVLDYVKYDLDINKLFWKRPGESVFSKQYIEKYRVQHEARIVIPDTFFYGLPRTMPFHELKVPVPGLQSYVHVQPASMFNSMLFTKFSEGYHRFTVHGGKKIFKENEKE